MGADSTSTDPTTHDPVVEEAYLEYLALREREPHLRLEEFVQRRPSLAGALRELHDAWSWFDGVRPPPDQGPPNLGDPYRVEGEIARGGMGVVYGVWDERLRRRLAMKVSRAADRGALAHGSAQQISVARFVEEAQITAQLDHPGVVPVHDMGTDASGRRFFTMRRVEGRTLDEVFELVRSGSEGWSRTRALGVLVQVCETIAFAHSRGVVHRDLKPTNVMVGRFGETYVMDWGLAKVLSRDGEATASVQSDRSDAAGEGGSSGLVTFAGAVVGTPAYMAPEQAEGGAREAGTAVDVYSLGAILYHLLAGRPPYGGRDGKGPVLDAVRRAPPPGLGRDTPPELAAICERAMARRADERYASVELLRDDLRAFLENRVVRAHRTGALAELSKWVARNRSLAAAFAAILLLVVAALVLQGEKSRLAAEGAEETRRLLGEARFESYVASLSAAASALDVGDAATARRRLEACPPEERDFEWRHLLARLDASLGTVALGRPISRVDVRPATGDVLVTYADEGGGLAVVDGEGRETPVEIEEPVRVAAYLKDGSVLAAAHAGRVRRIDPVTGAVLAVLEDGGRLQDVALDPMRERVAIGRADGWVEVRDARTLAEQARFSTGRGRLASVAWSPRGDRLAASSGLGTVTVWHVAGRNELGSIDAAADLGPVPADWAPVTFGPDGDTLLVGRPDGSIAAWRIADGGLAFVLSGHVGRVVDLLLAEDGNTLVSCSIDLSIAVWDLATGTLRDRMPGHVKKPMSLAPGSRPGTLVSGGMDGTLRTWAAGGRRALEVLEGHEETVYSVDVTADGVHLVSGGEDGTARVWDVASRQCARTLAFDRGAHVRAACGPDRTTLLVSAAWGRAAALSLFDLERSASRVLGDPPYHSHHPALSPDGSWAAGTVDHGAAIELFSVASGAVQTRLAQRSPGSHSFTADGRQLLTQTADGKLRVFSVPELELVRELDGHPAPPRSTAASPDGRLWATSHTDGVVLLWDARTGERLSALAEHDDSVTALAFSPDGRRLASASWDKSVRLWDVRRGRVVLVLTGHTAPVLDVAFSPDGAWMASAADDATVRLWDTRPARELLPAVLRAQHAREEVAPRVAALRAEHPLAEDRLAALRADSSLTGEQLRAAVALVQSEPEAAWILEERSRATVDRPDRGRSAYERALREAEGAARLEPERALFAHTLGVALFRLGRCERALEELRRAAARNRETDEYPRARDGAFLALCLAGLGRDADARAELALVREQLARQPDPALAPVVGELRERFGEGDLPR